MLHRFNDSVGKEAEMTLIEAASFCGLAANTLRALLHRRRLEGRKHGRDWFVRPSAIARYLASRDARGRRPRNARASRHQASG